MHRPNVLFLIWDACRYDAAVSHASNLRRLGESNLWFENAIAPSTWSLPSHAALFSGRYPSELGVLRAGERVDAPPLVSDLSARGYRTHGVSGNSFFSPSHGFDAPFDEFTYTTLLRYAEGMDVSELYDLFAARDPGVTGLLGVGASAARRLVAHDYPIQSAVNLATASIQVLSSGPFPQLNAVPHPVFNDYTLFSYTPEKNTRLVKSAIERRDDDRPFFVVANYMDTHRPYLPPERYQREFLGRTLSYRESESLNKDLADFWEHQTRLAAGDVADDELADLRGLYAGEVRSVDDHLGELLSHLERCGELDDTLVVVTADHGENLGELDEMGRVRMGHEASVSEHLLRVPLVVAHPALDARRVTEYVNIKDLYGLLTRDLEPFLASGGAELGSLVPDDGIVVVEHPAKGPLDFRSRYPGVPEDVATRVQSENAAAGYLDGWKVVLTDDDSWAWLDGETRPVSDAPERLVDACARHLSSLGREDDDELSDDAIRHLEDLGYL
ncbi:sulfatase-like hydrolase/transferase [Salinigranum sp.]|uniref:sulfatase-like hydrolase/transferase n=1 Tax=Salinigranum sp. TaxID=1966351 RepID=UPI0035630316